MQDLHYDTIEFTLKRERAGEIEAQLACFGWEIEREWDAKLYSDLVHVRFKRPHRVESKDRLQLLQVRVEIALNKQVKYERTMDSRALIFGLSLAVLALLSLGLGIAFVVAGYLPVWGYIIIAAASVALIFSTCLSVRIRRHDVKKYTALMRENEANIDEYCRLAREITGKGAPHGQE